MTLRIHRPYCRRPIFGVTLNTILCIGLIVMAKLQNLPISIYWIAAIFGVCGILFLVLAVTAPGTTISIDEATIARSGRVLGSTLRFDSIADARIERDPDAQNYKQITLRNHEGQTLLVDPRFLNPDVDGLIDLLRERLLQHGAELAEDH